MNPFVWFASGLAAAVLAILWTWRLTAPPTCDQCGGPMCRARGANGRVVRGIFKRRYRCAAGHTDERPTLFGRLFG